jgi:hypothetical protein
MSNRSARAGTDRPGFLDVSRARRPARTVLVGLLVAGLVTSAWLLLLVSPLTVAGGTRSPSEGAHALALPASHHRPNPPSGVPPAVAGPAPYVNTSVGSSNFDYSNTSCYLGNYYECTPWASQPSLLTLANGTLGLVYAVGSSQSNPVCGGLAATQTASRIAFTTSTDNGSSWATGSLIGQTNASCPYFQQFEPSFTVNASGGIVGAYVGANVTSDQLNENISAVCCPSPGLYSNYTNRSSDALIFANSSDQGGSFNETIVRAAGANIADPKIATYGNTIYIVYENVSNTTLAAPQILPGAWAFTPSPNYAISVWMIDSTDGGVHWNAPVPLPGENASQFNSSMSPAIAVSSAGEVAVAYLTNRSCIAYCASGSAVYTSYGDDVVVVTSSSNGSAWSPIHTVYSGSGESAMFSTYQAANQLYGYDDQLYNLFQYASAPVLAYNTTGSQLYIAWSGSYNISSANTLAYGLNYDWSYPTIFAGTSASGATGWTVASVAPVGTLNQTVYPNYLEPSYDLAPALAVDNGRVYLSYFYMNTTPTYLGTGSATCGFTSANYGLDSVAAEWLVTSPNGIDWSPRTMIGYFGGSTQPNAWVGTTGAVAVVNGSAIVAYSMVGYPVPIFYNGAYIYSTPSDIYVATPYTGPLTNLTLLEATPLPAGEVQYVGIDSSATYAVGDAGLEVTGVPEFAPVYVNVSSLPSRAGFASLPLGGGPYFLFGPTNVTIGWENFTYVNLTGSPLANDFNWNDVSFAYPISQFADQAIYYDSYTGTWRTYTGGTCPQDGMNALLPLGVNWTIGLNNPGADINVQDSWGSTAPSFVQGSGPGSFTGASGNFTVNASGPINETLYYYPSGRYTVDVAAPTLPNRTPFQFDWNGQPESSGNGLPVAIANVTTGYYYLDNATANSTQAGWTYAGTVVPDNPLFVPRIVSAEISFADIHVAAAAGTVSFHAGNLTNGTVWQLSFNGTAYSSNTPWINVTAHPGTYPVAGYPITSENASAAYVPVGLGPNITVAPGGTYDVNLTPEFKVTATASYGGTTTSPGSTWVAPGATESFTAAPAAGYAWVGWTGVGVGSYTGTDRTANVTAEGPIFEAATFAPLPANRFTLTVNETGIPNGTAWSIDLDGKGYRSSNATLTVPDLYSCAAPAAYSTYTLYVPDAYAGTASNLTRYVPGSYAASFCVRPTALALTFSSEYFLSLPTPLGGTATAAVGSGGFGGSTWVPALTPVTLRATAAAGYTFAGWSGVGPGNYTGSAPSPTLTLRGGVTETALFAAAPPPPPAPQYTETFLLASPFAPGTVWNVSLGAGYTFASTGSELNATGLPARTYEVVVAVAYAPDHLTRYLPQSTNFSLVVSANGSRTLAFNTQYWVAIASSGPGRTLPAAGGAWYGSGASLSLSALADPGVVFRGWAGTGAAAYSGSAANTTVRVTSPFTETASFAVAPPTSAQTVAGPWSSLGAEVGLAIVGLVVGAAVALLLLRARRPPAGEPARPGEVAPAGPSGTEPTEGAP